MTEPSKKADPVAQKKGDEFRRKRMRALVFHSAGYTFILLSGMFILMFLAGDYFNGVLGWFGLRGLSNPKTGVYADCSKAENKGRGFCQVTLPQAEQNWKVVKRRGTTTGAAFSLGN